MPQSITESDPMAASVRVQLALLNKSGRQLAAEMSWPYGHFIRRLTGPVPFTAVEVGRIAAHLGIPVQRLYEGMPLAAAEPAAAAS